MIRTGVLLQPMESIYVRLWTACIMTSAERTSVTTISNISMPRSPIAPPRADYPLFRCNGLTLSEPQKSTSPFYLHVFAPRKEYDIEFVQASNRQFWVGDGPKTYCPDEDGAGTECGSDTNTVSYSNSLSVTTPGGQRIFIQGDGTLAFTVAHSALEPDMAHDGENVAYSFSGYFGPDGSHWDADLAVVMTAAVLLLTLLELIRRRKIAKASFSMSIMIFPIVSASPCDTLHTLTP